MKPDSLSALQRSVLGELFRTGAPPGEFRLAGGTALSAFYLHHRLSFDLDLFSRDPLAFRSAETWVTGALDRLGASHRVVQRFEDFLEFLGGEDPDLGRPLRIQLVRDPGDILRPPVLHDGIPVSSLLDLGTEKLAALSDRHELKQYVDLYFLGRRPGYRVADLLPHLPRKQQGIHPLSLALDLEQVTQALEPWGSFEPWFLVAPPDPSEIDAWFREQAERVRDLAEGGL